MKTFRIAFLLMLSVVLLAGCSFFSSGDRVSEVPSDISYPDDPSAYIFFDDLSEDGTGDEPSQWTFVNAGGEYGKYEVVEEQPTDTGKAIQSISGPHQENKAVSMRAWWDEVDESVERLAIEYRFRVAEGKGLVYVKDSSNRIAWWAEEGRFVVNMGSGSQQEVPIGNEWYHLRFVADRTKNNVYVYLDDMDVPVMGPLVFLSEIDSWDGLRLEFTHWSKQRNEIYYADFRVWAVD